MEEEGEWVTLTLVYNLLYPLANCTFNMQVESRVSRVSFAGGRLCRVMARAAWYVCRL